MILDSTGRECRRKIGFAPVEYLTIEGAQAMRSLAGFGLQASPIVDEFGRPVIAATERRKIGDTITVRRPAPFNARIGHE